MNEGKPNSFNGRNAWEVIADLTKLVVKWDTNLAKTLLDVTNYVKGIETVDVDAIATIISLKAHLQETIDKVALLEPPVREDEYLAKIAELEESKAGWIKWAEEAQEIIEGAQANLKEMEESLKNEVASTAVANENMEQAQAKCRRLEHEVEIADGKLAEKEVLLASLVDDASNNEDTISRLMQETVDATRVTEKLTNEITDKDKRLQSREKALSSLDEQLGEEKEKSEALQAKIDKYKVFEAERKERLANRAKSKGESDNTETVGSKPIVQLKDEGETE